jgi:hypothetical protein
MPKGGPMGRGKKCHGIVSSVGTVSAFKYNGKPQERKTSGTTMVWSGKLQFGKQKDLTHSFFGYIATKVNWQKRQLVEGVVVVARETFDT